jgi:hypothetical protein
MLASKSGGKKPRYICFLEPLIFALLLKCPIVHLTSFGSSTQMYRARAPYLKRGIGSTTRGRVSVLVPFICLCCQKRERHRLHSLRLNFHHQCHWSERKFTSSDRSYGIFPTSHPFCRLLHASWSRPVAPFHLCR